MPPLLVNASAYTLQWQQVPMATGEKSTYVTGTSSFDCHFAPAGGTAVARAKAMGLEVTFEIHCDYELAIKHGDVVVLTNLGGVDLSPVRWLSVTSVSDYASTLLGHQVLGLKEYKQNFR